MGISAFFRALGGFLKRAFGIAQSRGLTDDLVTRALVLVRLAQTKFDTNAERREWVIVALLSAGASESLARLAIELAVQMFKKERET